MLYKIFHEEKACGHFDAPPPLGEEIHLSPEATHALIAAVGPVRVRDNVTVEFELEADGKMLRHCWIKERHGGGSSVVSFLSDA